LIDKFLPLVFAVTATLAYAQQPEGTDFKKLFLQALNSPSGKSRTDVTGPIADSIRLQTNSPNSRVVAEVNTVKDLPQNGCKRLRIVFTTPGMLYEMREGPKAPLKVGALINMCPDGQPPGDEPVATAQNSSK